MEGTGINGRGVLFQVHRPPRSQLMLTHQSLRGFECLTCRKLQLIHVGLMIAPIHKETNACPIVGWRQPGMVCCAFIGEARHGHQGLMHGKRLSIGKHEFKMVPGLAALD